MNPFEQPEYSAKRPSDIWYCAMSARMVSGLRNRIQVPFGHRFRVITLLSSRRRLSVKHYGTSMGLPVDDPQVLSSM